MFDLSLLPDGGLGWLDASGEQSDVVLSTRVRLARNVEGYAFTGRSREGERLRILAQVRDAVPAVTSLNGGVLVRRWLYYRGQAVARVRHVAFRA